jgi:hypothetical protein
VPGASATKKGDPEVNATTAPEGSCPERKERWGPSTPNIAVDVSLSLPSGSNSTATSAPLTPAAARQMLPRGSAASANSLDTSVTAPSTAARSRTSPTSRCTVKPITGVTTIQSAALRHSDTG